MDNLENLFLSKKYSLSEKRLFLLALVQQVIYTKIIYENNPDLKNYTAKYEILYKLPEDKKFKDYLFSSRTTLAARVTRLIIEKNDLEIEKQLMDWHIQLFNKNDIKTPNPNSSKKNQKTSLLEDMLQHSR